MNRNKALARSPSVTTKNFVFGIWSVLWLTLAPMICADPPPGGVVPVSAPVAGFAIDGNVFANTPASGVGDWVASPSFPGSGTGALTLAGVPLNPQTTFHVRDPFNSTATDLIFAGGKKWFDDPNTWEWATSKPSSKTDINNALLHVGTDTNGHVWVVVSADRLSTSGDSYIDFEFLQNPLTRNTNDNKFTSAGPHGGRTTNDVLLSLAFTGGGDVPDFFVWCWQRSGSSYVYVAKTTNLAPGRVFASLNTNSTPVPYGAFGGTNYAANAFAEGAVDLTALLGGFDPCLSVGFKTIMIKTKASASSSASIEDFVDPIQYNLNVGPRADAGPDQTRCTEGNSTTFPIQGQAGAGFYPVSNATWSVVSGDVTIEDTNSLSTTAHVTSANAVLRLTVVQINGCTETDDVVLWVAPLPDCSITGASTTCPGLNAQFTGPAGMNSYAWTISGSGTISGPANQRTVTVAAGTVCGGSFTLSLNVTSNQCSSACNTQVLLADATPPVLNAPADRILECPADTRTNATGSATATDDCGFTTVSYSDETNSQCGGGMSIARTWTATDRCGNTASHVQNITLRDTTAPLLACPPNRTLECPADTSPASTGSATASDACSSFTISFSDLTSNSCAGTKVIWRTWAAVDACSNAASCVQIITVRDTAAPAITCPASVTLECPANTTTNSTGVATATDACGSVSIGYTETLTNLCGNTFIIMRRWTATDECGNTSSCNQTITVRDTTAPVITCPASVTLECPAVTTTNNTGVAAATDACGGPITIAYSDSNTNGCGGTRGIVRTWSATDACGNRSTCVQTITVVDTTAPNITCNPSKTVECTDPWAFDPPTASDGCGTATITVAGTVTNAGCGNTFTATRTWRATDACGNQTICSQIVTIVDTRPPTINCVSGKTVECGSPWSFDLPTATDTCGTNSIAVANTITNGGCGRTFTAMRTWRATDACGNQATCSQTVSVVDTTPPVIACVAAKTVQCGSGWSFDAPAATDVCGTAGITVVSTLTNAGCGNTFTATRTWRATDECGNQATCSQTVNVLDTTAPVITCVGDKTVQCVAAWSFDAPTATDGCGTNGIIIVSTVTNSGCGNTFTATRTWRATDACGNQATCSQRVSVVDTTPPVISCADNKYVNCASPWTFDEPVASDTCGTTTVAILSTVTNHGCGTTFTATRTWRATDACGNQATCSQTVSLLDLNNPHLVIPPDLTLECPADTSTNATGAAFASDTCGSVMVRYSDSTINSCGGTKVISRAWTATDACNNVARLVQTITVRDTRPPAINVPVSVTLECGANTAPSATGTATAQDACNTATVSYSDTVSNGCGGTRAISRRWSAVDACGNTTNAVQTITVRDSTPPALTMPANRVLECPGDTRTNVTGVATATDVCGSVAISYSDVVSNSCGLTKTVWRLWTATDQCGNTTNGLQTITVRDITAPRITAPNISVQCADDVPPPHANLTAFLAAGGTASDSCDAALTFSMTSNSVLVGSCPGTMTRVYRVTDDCGNFAEVTQRITVDDTIAPSLTCPPSVTVECGASLAPANLGNATATDNCTANVNITNSDAVVQGEYDLKFYVADPDSGTGPYSPTYLQFAPASLPCPDAARLTGRALDPLRNAVAFAPSGQLDALTSIGNVPMSFGQVVPYEVVIEASGGPGPERGTIEFTAAWSTYTTSNNRFGYDTNYMVYCAFVDAADPGSIDPNVNARVESYSSVVINRGTIDERIQGTFRVSGLDAGDRVVVEIWVVLDSTMPEHTGGTVAADLVSAQKASLPPVPITVGQQTDSLGNLSRLGALPPPQTQPPLGPLPPQPPVPPGATVSVIDRTWAATDDCGNRGTCVQRITVRDTAPPAMVVPADLSLECPADTTANSTGAATAVDGCGSVSVAYSDLVTAGCGATWIVRRTWTATDQNGNTTNAIQTIIVLDTTPPALVCKPDRSIAGAQAWSFDEPTATDACGTATVRVLSTITNVLGEDSYSATRSWQATDACTNTSTCQQTITVTDLPTPGLQLVSVSSGMMTLRWAAFPAGYQLESCGDLNLQNWRPVWGTTVLSNGYYYCVLPLTQSPIYFRLGTPVAKLWLDPAGPGKLLVDWSAMLTGYQLEATESLTSPDWVPVPATPVSSNGYNCVLIATTSPMRFFRLAPPVPKLWLVAGTAGKLIVRWPALVTGYQLEACDNLASPNWTPVLIAPETTDGFTQVEFVPNAPQQFYRLRPASP